MLLLGLAVGLTACPDGPTITLHGTAGPVRVTVELAATPDTRALGLMYRTELAASRGMLFVFPDEDQHSFWMKNTPLPLDMIFIGRDGRVVGVVPNTRPFSTTGVGVDRPSLYVLEVNAGFAASHGIAAGTAVEFTPAPPPGT